MTLFQHCYCLTMVQIIEILHIFWSGLFYILKSQKVYYRSLLTVILKLSEVYGSWVIVFRVLYAFRHAWKVEVNVLFSFFLLGMCACPKGATIAGCQYFWKVLSVFDFLHPVRYPWKLHRGPIMFSLFLITFISNW